MATPPVFDIAALLAPIPGDRRAGALLRRSSPELEELSGLLPRPDMSTQEDANASANDWSPDALIERATDILSYKSKDLRIGIWLLRALVTRHGLAGLRDGLLLINGLLDTYWDDMGPLLDDDGDGDSEARRKAIEYICYGNRITSWLMWAPLANYSTFIKRMPIGQVDVSLELIKNLLEIKSEIESTLCYSRDEFLPCFHRDAEQALDALKRFQEISSQRFPDDEPVTYYVSSSVWEYVRRVHEVYAPSF